MCLLPDCCTAQRPGCPDTNKPVLFRVPEKKSDIDEEPPGKEGKREVRADLVPGAPEYDLDLDRQHEEDKKENEPLVPVPEFLVILFVRVNAGKNSEQGDKAHHNKGDEKESPELR